MSILGGLAVVGILFLVAWGSAIVVRGEDRW